MSQKNVAIVGAGMAGGFLAACLAKTGLSVQLLDGAPPPAVPQGNAEKRVVALTEASQRMMVRLGIWELLDASRLAPYRQMQVWDADGSGQVDFQADQVAASSLGWMVENQHLVAALYQWLEAQENVGWSANCKVAAIEPKATGWQVSLASGESVNCRLLVGADGARSMVRNAAGIAVSHRNTGHRALVTALQTEHAHGNCSRQWFHQSGPLAFLPLFGDGHQVSIVWSCREPRVSELQTMALDAFNEALYQASSGELGRVQAVDKPLSFPIREQHASQYIAKQLALVGDAAHVVHPLAGQGINLGLLDAGVLAEEVANALARGMDWSDVSVLSRYQRRRRGHNLMMQQSFRGFQKVFEWQSPAFRWLRNSGMKLVNDLVPVKHRVIEEAMGRHGDLPEIAKP